MNEKVNEVTVADVTTSTDNVNDIIAERDNLLQQVEELKQRLAVATEERERFGKYWLAEDKKVKILLMFIRSGVNPSETMTAGDLMAKLIEKMA